MSTTIISLELDERLLAEARRLAGRQATEVEDVLIQALSFCLAHPEEGLGKEALLHVRQFAQFMGERTDGDWRETSPVFPWLRHLDDEERQEFTCAYIETFNQALEEDEWEALHTFLEGWEATAELNRYPDILAAVLEPADPHQFIEVRPPGG